MFRNPTTDLIVILVIVLLIFGPKRLPSLGKQLGSGIREFKDGITGKAGEDEDEEDRPQLEQAPAAAPVEATPVHPTPVETAPVQSSPVASEHDAAQVGPSERRP